ncbi:DUF7210 family protein [Commensalibacter oyaizuii]|uniref:Uncharacterized protein n=1 Tax=Commensalibacter oyaizuii TaxID=3043873 RepID=A0ABT6Q3C4_9PROT|nr:hypothetical protein [Commensalibacter sp. TBRC 16381]MDI2091618.1 hypothetical protein [Commensalibacter sp. TBRC 16381]
MAKDIKDTKDLEKEKDSSDLEKEKNSSVDSNESEGNGATQTPPSGDDPSKDQSLGDKTKEQNGNQPSALFVSTGKTTITVLQNRTLRHNGVKYKGGTTLDLPTKDADFLIKNHYAVAGSILPAGGVVVPKTHTPKAGSDAS